jgi:predicted ATPase
MKISNIKIRNFKSIKEMDLALKDLNILIGPNGAGKSNFISFFNFLNYVLEDNLDYYVKKQGGADNLLHFGRNHSQEIFFRIDFDNKQYCFCNIEPLEGRDSLFIKEIFMSVSESDEWFEITNEVIKNLKNKISANKSKALQTLMGKRFSLKELNDSLKKLSFTKEEIDIVAHHAMSDRQISEYMQKAFAASKVYHFHDTSSSAKVKQICNINDNRFLRPDAGNLSAFLYFLQQKHTEHFNQIQDTIRLVAPFFSSFSLSPLKLNEEKICLEWKHRESDEYFNAYQLSDGTLRMISLATLLLQPELPDIILIDEPELGLHPYAITILSNLLEIASEHSQIIVSTQSVTLLEQFAPDDVIVIDRDNTQSSFKRLNEKELEIWLEDYTLGEIWEKNVIGGRP